MKKNNVNNIIFEQQVPQMALVVYRNNQSGNTYIESHRINAEGKMLAGCPLTLKCITELVESFSIEQGNMPHGIITPNMLYVNTRKGHERYIWYNPPEKRIMFFSGSLNIEDGEYRIPGIIYDTDGERLNVYAFKGRKPEPESRLFKAPFFNVTGEKVCLGNAKVQYPDNPAFRDYILYWEKKFWLTDFSHLGGSMNPTKNNLVTVTKGMRESFDYNELIPFRKDKKTLTLKELLK